MEQLEADVRGRVVVDETLDISPDLDLFRIVATLTFLSISHSLAQRLLHSVHEEFLEQVLRPTALLLVRKLARRDVEGRRDFAVKDVLRILIIAWLVNRDNEVEAFGHGFVASR